MRPLLYPRCFLGWWVSQDAFSTYITSLVPQWSGDTGWLGGGLAISPHHEFLPVHDFGDVPYLARCIQITEEMCEPDPQVLVDALEVIIKHQETVLGDKLKDLSVDRVIALKALAKYRREEV